MTRPEIVMQTPEAKQLEISVQRKLAEFSYSTADDVVMAEYVVVMLANAKTPEQITAELTELIGEDMYDPQFTKWLFEEVARQYGLDSSPSIPPQSPTENQDQSFQSNNPQVPDIGDKIETVNDSRDHSYHPPSKRNGNGINPSRFNQSIFSQSVNGLKRPGTNDIHRETPHRRPRQDEFSNSIPTGPRSMDRNSRDNGWQTNPNNHKNSLSDPRDGPNSQRVAPHNNYPSPSGGNLIGTEPIGKSILERVGMSGNGSRPFQNSGFQPGYDNRSQPLTPPFRRNRESNNNSRPHVFPSSQPIFYGSPSPYPIPLLPNNHFPQQAYNPHHTPNSITPQLFLANGQPFMPPYNLPNHPANVPHPAMFSHPIIPPIDRPIQSDAAPLQLTKAENHTVDKVTLKSPPTNAKISEPELSIMPSKPLLRQECKYNLACKNAWCPSSHCSPKGDPKNSMLLSFDPCEKQLECQDSDCLKAHVSPQQSDPKSSIKPSPIVKPTSAQANSQSVARPSTTVPTPCRFGSHCTRSDCMFTHPWIAKSVTASIDAGTIIDKDPNSKASFAHVPCKFGLGCVRPDCHFQHPPAVNHWLPSKNISKTFNKTESTTLPISKPASSPSTKLEPSKKFTPQKLNDDQSKTNGEEKNNNLTSNGNDDNDKDSKTDLKSNNHVSQVVPPTTNQATVVAN
ncbi:hypothetical protein O181_053261 [Austropuccinia psidii MF-1]|uniref:C3H1-type domain-containing protein n=1 Tax=Austropuccinia psidii MF-1 TaxID=1389203 RepID=A0A9Q3E762_9BASI|nr:hypothetical protein [Austropuccinia psidii MF-1]